MKKFFSKIKSALCRVVESIEDFCSDHTFIFSLIVNVIALVAGVMLYRHAIWYRRYISFLGKLACRKTRK